MPNGYLLPLFAALALSSAASVTADEAPDFHERPNPATHSRVGFLHAMIGQGSVDLVADGKTLRRNIKYGRIMKPKTLSSEGYAIDVNAAKIGLPYIENLPLAFVGGRDYSLIAVSDDDVPTTMVIVDVASLVIPKDSAHVVFANASTDATSVSLVIDDQEFFAEIPPGTFAGPVAINKGKHRIGASSEGAEVLNTRTENLKGGRTTTFIVIGTVETGDGKPLRLEQIETKSR